MKNRTERDENIEDMLGLIGLFIIVLFLLFNHFFYDKTSSFFLKISQFEIWVVLSIKSYFGSYDTKLHQYLTEISAVLASERYSLETAKIALNKADEYFRLIYVLPIIWVMLKIKNKQTLNNYKEKLTGNAHIQKMSKIFPRIRPIVHLDYGQGDEERGAFTYMISPFDWALKKGVITLGTTPLETKRSFLAKKCEQAIIDDIHLKPFTTIEALSPIKQILFVIYGLWFCEKYKEHNQLLDEIASGFYRQDKDTRQKSFWAKYFQKNITIQQEQFGVNYILEIRLKTYLKIQSQLKLISQHKKIKKIINDHLFEETILRNMFSKIQKTTVAYIIWLKAMNRSLFYFLHNEGMETDYIETKGAAMIYKREVDAIDNNSPLVPHNNRGLITTEEIISIIDETEEWVRDVYYTLETSGWMSKEQIFEYTDKQLKALNLDENTDTTFNYNNPVLIYFEYKKEYGDKTVGRSKVNNVIFYSLKTSRTLTEIEMPNYNPDEIQIKKIQHYIDTRYIYYLSKPKHPSWLTNQTMLNMDRFAGYNFYEDALEAFDLPKNSPVIDIFKAAGHNDSSLTKQERYSLLFDDVKNALIHKYKDIEPLSIRNKQ